MAGKSDNPPPLPHAVLERVQNVGSIEGRFCLMLSAVFAILAAASGDYTGAIAGCVAAGAGAMELQGSNRLKAKDLHGITLLVRSQLLLLATVLVYLVLRLRDPDYVTHIVDRLLTPELRERFAAQNVGEEELVTLMNRSYRSACYLVGMLSVIYQGGMALYYLRRRETVRRAFED